MWIESSIKINSYLKLSKNLNSKRENTLQDNNYLPVLPSVKDSTDKIKSMGSFKVLPDSVLKIIEPVKMNEDSLQLLQMSIDSTARLENLKYKPKYFPFVKFEDRKISPLFLQPSATYRTRTIDIDSTGKYVIIKESIYGIQSKILLKIPIDEYINLKLRSNQVNEWGKLVGKYEVKSSTKELGQLIKNITNFEIPLPSVGVLSIFGPPKIGLKIGGAVDIQGSFKTETTQGVAISQLGNTRSTPNFKQQVQINVKGTIGDKLNINADWNTERTFQYENQLKIKYTGYEDEIIQSIEAGNVSLQTSPLVG
ncbi:MAG TPA: hypothetical protein ENI57_05155, partial [Ignavibacteria bacterium]|nr:hypothetical protein [Ignavibacteria bacterium]